MINIDFSKITEEELIKAVSQMSLKTLQQISSYLSYRQVQIVTACLQNISPHYLNDFTVFLPSNILRKAAGNALNSQGLMTLLDGFQQKNTDILSNLLAGVSPQVFQDCLPEFTTEHLEALKKCVQQEPLLHLLTLYSHFIQEHLKELNQQILHLEQEIKYIHSSELTYASILACFHHFTQLSQHTAYIKKGLSKALLISWNSERKDLINTMSHLKELVERLSVSIGYSRMDERSATGLYKKLEQHLSKVYEEGLQDDDPAIEALAALSVVQREDFLEVGLLNPSSIDSSHFLKQVEEKLDNLGLYTVKDVKKALIFSRTILKEFLSTN